MLRRFVLISLVTGAVAVLVTACDGVQPNHPPDVALRSDFTAGLGHLVSVVASASDVDGDALEYQWELINTPEGASPTLDTDGGHAVVLSTDIAGEYELRVVVDDGQATASDEVAITFDPDFELDPWAAMSASPYVIPEVASVYLPDPETGEPVLTEVAVLAGFVVQGGDLVLGRLEDLDGVAPSSFVRESAKFPSSEIPYQFGEFQFSQAERATIKSALDALAAETGVLTFVDVTNTITVELRISFERNILEGLHNLLPGCWAEKNFLVQPGIRVVHLGIGCMSERTIKHEVLHALGLYHEHQRHDRDTYVDVTRTILPDTTLGNIAANIESAGNYLLNYAKPPDGRASDAYDWLSIMHYSFGTWKGVSLEPKPGALPTGVYYFDVGQVAQLSADDIEAIRKLYSPETDPGNNVALAANGATTGDNGHFDDGVHTPGPSAWAIDGDLTTYWAGLAHVSPQMMWVNFDANYSINRVIIHELSTAYINTGLLEYFDGSTWRTLIAIEKAAAGFEVEFASVNASAVRLTVNSNTAPSGWYNRVACITELEVYLSP